MRSSRMRRFAPGIGCIAFGLLIVVFPMILVALIAAMFMALGMVLLWLARMEESEWDFHSRFRTWYSESPWRERFHKMFIYRF